MNLQRQINDTELESMAAEIRVRAERRAGQLLSERVKSTGGDRAGRRPKLGGPRRRPPKNPPETLRDLGISKHESSLWQQTAAVPEEEFEALIAKRKGKKQPVSSVDVLKRARKPAQRAGRRKDYPRCLLSGFLGRRISH